VSTLGVWDRSFDAQCKPLKIPDGRGRKSKVEISVVRCIIEKAQGLIARGKRIRIKHFTSRLRKEDDIHLSAKTVREILIANDLIAAHSRKRRPKFYQSLCMHIPNGLLSFDGSEFTVWLNDQKFTFNVELGVDVAGFAHTAFSIADTETAGEVINVLESHRKRWGVPVGVLCDHRSGNLSKEVVDYLFAHEIEQVPAGPDNAKGNGTCEGAFSQMKKALGTIVVNTSSPKTLAHSILHLMVDLYIRMRNRLCKQGYKQTPLEEITIPISEERRRLEKQRLKAHKKVKETNSQDQLKLDRLHWVIKDSGFEIDPVALKRAEYSIKFYDLAAIGQTEAVFIKAVRKDAGRNNIAYFFGILRNIQQKIDHEVWRQYCSRRYNYQTILNRQREQEQQEDTITVDNVVRMLEQAVTVKVQFVKELAIRKASQWALELMQDKTYIRPVRNKISDAIGALKNLTFDQRQYAMELFDQFLQPSPAENVLPC
jgi:hypothetical protein